MRDFFVAFEEAFQSFDGTEVARRYVAPYVALHGNGALECFDSQLAIAAYFQSVIDTYYQRGCRSCRFSHLDALPLGEQSVLATVNWALLDEEAKVLSSWRESYNLHRSEGALRIFASIDHVG